MSEDGIIALAHQSFYIILLIITPPLLVGLVVGLAVSIFQATTQIQEQTLAFIPKIIAILVSLVLFGPWMLRHLLEFTTNLFTNLNKFVG